jgi:Protein of unknown function (DUF1579)
MMKIHRTAALVIASLLALPALPQTPPATTAKPPVPAWIQRGAKGPGQAAMAPLIGTWNVELSVYGTLGRDPAAPPLVSRDLRATRSWIADGHYLEESIEGSIAGVPYWRRGWLGYSNMDRRFEWITVAPLVPMMFYQGKPGSGAKMPIEMTGTFTDQGVVSERTVGKIIGQRTVIRADGPDRQTTELYFRLPSGKEQLAMRMVFTRAK